ncbi:MAG: BatA and WFA domain-containing protein [Candidatus Aureabacteria bacterium]|nr:BatA and WFA domain-containing protein [Candidatus Auribacterota bacterium]
MGLANLSGLIYLLSVPALVYIYYFSRKKKRVEISSIIPWRLLRESVVRSSLFRADLLFYLQLALLLILVTAACRPYWRSAAPEAQGRHVIVIMDRSASMQTREEGGSRWDLARDRALRLVRGLADHDRVTLIATGARAETLASAEGNRPRLEAILQGLAPADTPDAMAPALQLALGLFGEPRGMKQGTAPERRGETALHIFTDRSSESLGLGKHPSAGSIHIERVGSPKENAGITSLSIYRNLFSARPQVSAYVTVENLSGQPFSGSLRALVKGKEIASLPIALEPGSSRTTQVGEQLPEGVVEIVLDPADALRIDNKAYLLLPGRRAVRIALFTRDVKCAEQFRGLASAIPRLTLDVLNPAAYGTVDMAPYAVAIFHRCEPEKEPGANLLMICPPTKSRIVRVANDWVSGVSFLDWDESHPVGENLRGLQNVPLSGSRVVDTPPWAKPVVISATTAGDIPLVTCGDYKGRRAAVVSFDLSEMELKKESSLPALILLLNAIKWLSTDERDQIKTGEPYETLVPEGGRRSPGRGKSMDDGIRATAGSCTVINPRGGEESIGVTPGEPLVFAGTDYAGCYLLTGKSVQKTFVANLCSRMESDLRSDEQGEDRVTVAEVVAVSAARQEPPDRSVLFFSLAALLILLEWMIWSAGTGRAKAATAAGDATE